MSVLFNLTLHIYESNNVSLSALTWNKSPPNPFEGILGENVILKWNFTLTSAETFDYFLLLENGDDVLKYNENKAIVTYRGDVVLERNGTPSFTLINLKWRNDGKKYCLKVGTRNKGQGKIYKNCTRLKILGKVVFKLPMCLFAFYSNGKESKGTEIKTELSIPFTSIQLIE